jgi:hypothetical protein
MRKLRFADKASVECAIVEIEEVRCDVNADFTEHLADSERFDESRFSKQRRAFEKKWRDPDDVYIDVQRREEEREKQGLPPGLGVIPGLMRGEDDQSSAINRLPKRRRNHKRSPVP